MKRAASNEAIRAARIAELALRDLLGAGEAPTPDAFARAYAATAARVGAASPAWSHEASKAYAESSTTRTEAAHREGRTRAPPGGNPREAGDASGVRARAAPPEPTEGPGAPAATQPAKPPASAPATPEKANAQGAAARATDARRVTGLLAAALAALGSARGGEASGGECVELAARLLAGGDARGLADDIERAIGGVSSRAGEAGLPWRDITCDALRHLVLLLPEGAAAGEDLQRSRTLLRRAEGAALASTLASLQRLLRRSLLAS